MQGSASGRVPGSPSVMKSCGFTPVVLLFAIVSPLLASARTLRERNQVALVASTASEMRDVPPEVTVDEHKDLEHFKNSWSGNKVSP